MPAFCSFETVSAVPFPDIFKILIVANIDFLNKLLSNYNERLCDVVYLSNWISFRWKLSCPYVTKVTNISGLFLPWQKLIWKHSAICRCEKKTIF